MDNPLLAGLSASSSSDSEDDFDGRSRDEVEPAPAPAADTASAQSTGRAGRRMSLTSLLSRAEAEEVVAVASEKGAAALGYLPAKPKGKKKKKKKKKSAQSTAEEAPLALIGNVFPAKSGRKTISICVRYFPAPLRPSAPPPPSAAGLVLHCEGCSPRALALSHPCRAGQPTCSCWTRQTMSLGSTNTSTSGSGKRSRPARAATVLL